MLDGPVAAYWPVSVVLVVFGLLTMRRWQRGYAAGRQSGSGNGRLRLERWRLTLVGAAFGMVVPFLIFLWLDAPEWVALACVAAIVACMAVAAACSAIIGWKYGR